MKPLTLIIAMVLEPIGPITDTPFQYGIDQLEVIEVQPLDRLEQKLRHDELKQRYRILEAQPNDR